MPCNDWPMVPAGYEYVSREEDQKRRNIEAALCMFMRTFQYEDHLMAYLDFEEAGITKKWLDDWWTEHKKRDEARSRIEAEKRQKELARAAALEKLTDEEKKLLGLIK